MIFQVNCYLDCMKNFDKNIQRYEQRPIVLANIPWVSPSPTERISFKLDSLYKMTSHMAAGDESILDMRKLVLYMLLGTIFPIFLPQR
jgi:hypothetical protein